MHERVKEATFSETLLPSSTNVNDYVTRIFKKHEDQEENNIAHLNIPGGHLAHNVTKCRIGS